MFNGSQKRYVFSHLRSIEETLSEAVEQLAPRESGRVFRTVSPDASAGQRKILSDYLAEQLEKVGVRLAMVLNTVFSLPPGAAAVSANRSLP